ncbi:MAG: hypothetical protein PVJ09_00290 [Candidatus Woesebacteria bacterium]|jgi:hypothetical protein
MRKLFDPQLRKTFRQDKRYLEKTELPIITVSATYKEDLKGLHGLPEVDTIPDIVFSRAHYSMALGVAVKQWGKHIDPKKAWVVDPTNYVCQADLHNIQLTEAIGKTLARYSFLKKIKDLVDKFARQKLPILKSITPPLLYLSENIKKPILSFHIAAGNILASLGKEVIQVITDPHVREDYLVNADRPNMKFAVFDQDTKKEFFEKAEKMGKKVKQNQVIVTGSPIDPRILKTRKNKHAWRCGVLKLCITTGGLGTNKYEIKNLLKQLLPIVKEQKNYRLMVYAGTQKDIKEMVLKLAKKYQIEIYQPEPKDPAPFALKASLIDLESSTLAPYKQEDEKKACPQKKLLIDQEQAFLTLLYHPQIVDANELLIKFAFPWADGFITKPSGDMAYDAVASGSFLLTLKEWGEWEHNIRKIFEQKEISQKANVKNIIEQLDEITQTRGRAQSWVEKAMLNAVRIDPLFLKGARNILKAVKSSK